MPKAALREVEKCHPAHSPVVGRHGGEFAGLVLPGKIDRRDPELEEERLLLLARHLRDDAIEFELAELGRIVSTRLIKLQYLDLGVRPVESRESTEDFPPISRVERKKRSDPGRSEGRGRCVGHFGRRMEENGSNIAPSCRSGVKGAEGAARGNAEVQLGIAGTVPCLGPRVVSSAQAIARAPRR